MFIIDLHVIHLHVYHCCILLVQLWPSYLFSRSLILTSSNNEEEVVLCWGEKKSLNTCVCQAFARSLLSSSQCCCDVGETVLLSVAEMYWVCVGCAGEDWQRQTACFQRASLVFFCPCSEVRDEKESVLCVHWGSTSAVVWCACFFWYRITLCVCFRGRCPSISCSPTGAHGKIAAAGYSCSQETGDQLWFCIYFFLSSA